MNKKALIFILLAITFIPFFDFVMAIDLETLLQNIINVFLMVASALVVILWVTTGLLFLFAQGDPQKLSTAKQALLWSVIGTVVILLANGALQMIKSALGVGTTGSGGGS